MESTNITPFEDFMKDMLTRASSTPEHSAAQVAAEHTQHANAQTRKLAATRKSRTRYWPARSGPHPVFPSLLTHKAERGDEITEIELGMDSGRNLLAIFEDCEAEPRLRYNIRCRNGRSKQLWPKFKGVKDANIPVGTTLRQICRYFPLHVWGDGIRIFMAEGWTAEQIWKEIPAEARNAGAATRPWNYLQQAMGREADKMYQENGNLKRIPAKRKRAETFDGDNNDEQNLNSDVPAGRDVWSDQMGFEIQALSNATTPVSGHHPLHSADMQTPSSTRASASPYNFHPATAASTLTRSAMSKNTPVASGSPMQKRQRYHPYHSPQITPRSTGFDPPSSYSKSYAVAPFDQHLLKPAMPYAVEGSYFPYGRQNVLPHSLNELNLQGRSAGNTFARLNPCQVPLYPSQQTSLSHCSSLYQYPAVSSAGATCNSTTQPWPQPFSDNLDDSDWFDIPGIDEQLTGDISSILNEHCAPVNITPIATDSMTPSINSIAVGTPYHTPQPVQWPSSSSQTTAEYQIHMTDSTDNHVSPQPLSRQTFPGSPVSFTHVRRDTPGCLIGQSDGIVFSETAAAINSGPTLGTCAGGDDAQLMTNAEQYYRNFVHGNGSCVNIERNDIDALLEQYAADGGLPSPVLPPGYAYQ